MKTLKILPLLVFLAFPCLAQTSLTPITTTTPTTPPTGEGAGPEQKLQQMTPEQRQEFLQNHPEIRERIRHREEMLNKLQTMTPEQRQEFLQNHPKIQQFINNHPNFAQKLANGSEAGAGIKDPGHPRVNEVNQREQDQQQRIAQGVKNDSLTPQQTSQLEKGENRIQHQEAHDLDKHDGHLTKAEQRRLNREENRESEHIYKDKHD
jgi:hypothetical protein